MRLRFNDLRMNTLALGKEAKTFAKSKQILLTLRKTAGNCHMTAVITPINENRGLRIVDRKLVVIKKNSGDGRSLFSKENNGLDKVNGEVDGLQMPKTKQKSTKSRKNFSIGRKYSILKNCTLSEVKSCRNCSEVDDLDTKSLGTILNKHDRFVPNILRSNKAVENVIHNDTTHVDFDATRCEISRKTEEKNIKRNRKQVLRPLDNKHDCARRNYWEDEKNELNTSLPCVRNENLAPESETETLPVAPSNFEPEAEKQSVEIEEESTAVVEEDATDDVYSADLNIACENVDPPCSEKTDIDYTDVSIKKIFDEFEVPDYQNYIASEYLNFQIDEMDKLLSSDLDGSLTGCDVNDNIVDSQGNGLKKRKYKNKRKSSDIRRKTEYYDHETEPTMKTRRIQWYKNRDNICSGSFEYCKMYQTSKMGRGSYAFQDYSSSDDVQHLNHSLKGDSSVTDSASECEHERTNSVQSLDLLLQKKENLDCLSTSLAVSDVVPDNVFSEEFSSESCSDGLDSGDDAMKRQLNSSAIMQRDDMNLIGINDDLSCSEPLGRLSDLELFDGLDTTLGLSEDGHYLLDDTDCPASTPDESCKSILADSNIEFDDEHLFNILNVLPDLDFENANDIEISKLLRLDNAAVNKFQPVTDPPLQSTVMSPLSELISTELDLSAEREMEKIIEAGCNLDAEFTRALKDRNFLFDDGGNIRELGLNNNRDFEWPDPLSMNVSSARDELVSSRDLKTKDIDDTKSDGRCSTPLLTEEKNVEVSKMSKLESLLSRPRTYVDNRSEISTINSKFDWNKLTVGCSKVDIPNSPIILSDKNSPPGVTEYQSTEDTFQSREAKDTNDQGTPTDSDQDKFCSRTKSMKSLLLELHSSHDQHSYQSLSHLHQESLKNSSSSGSLCDDLGKPELQVAARKKLVKRRKYATRNRNGYFPCHVCDLTCRSDIALANHIDARHRGRASQLNASTKKYVCDKCSKQYSVAGAIEKHFALHDNYSLSCRMCEKHFSEKIYLRRHIYSEHLYWGYECSYCTRKFSTKNVLTRHLKECHCIKYR